MEVRLPGQRLLAGVSRQSHPSANDDNESVPGVLHIQPGIYLKADESPENVSKEAVDEGCSSIHRLKWDLLPSNDR